MEENHITKYGNKFSGVLKQYKLTAPPNEQVWHKAFLRWVRAPGWSPDSFGIPQNASGSVGIPLKGVPQVPGDRPNPSEED